MAAKRRAKNRTRGLDLWEVFPELVRPEDLDGQRDTRFRTDGTPERAYKLKLGTEDWEIRTKESITNPDVREGATLVIFYLTDVEHMIYLHLAETAYGLWRSDLLKEDEDSLGRSLVILSWRRMVQKCFEYLFLRATMWPSYHTWKTLDGGHYQAEGGSVSTIRLTEQEGAQYSGHGLETRHTMSPIRQWTLDLYEITWTVNTMALMGLNVHGTDFGATRLHWFINRAPFIVVPETAVVPSTLEWRHTLNTPTCALCGRPIRFHYTASVRLKSWAGSEYDGRDLCIECLLMMVEYQTENKIPVLGTKDFLQFTAIPVKTEGFGQCQWKVAEVEPTG